MVIDGEHGQVLDYNILIRLTPMGRFSIGEYITEIVVGYSSRANFTLSEKEGTGRNCPVNTFFILDSEIYNIIRNGVIVYIFSRGGFYYGTYKGIKEQGDD